MSAKHTPGPWYLKATQHANGTLCHYVCHGDDEIICTTETDDMPGSCLLAAAPEMYAALECFVDNWSHEDGASYPHYEDVTKAIEALKKARGES